MKVRVFMALLIVLALTATIASAGYYAVKAVGANTAIEGSGCPASKDGDEDGQFITIESGEVVVTNYNRFGGIKVGDVVWLSVLKGCRAGEKVVYDLVNQEKK